MGSTRVMAFLFSIYDGLSYISILRRILPIHSSKEDDHQYNSEYSLAMEYTGRPVCFDIPFAMEYTGPPVCFDIPTAVPVDVVSIPTASGRSSGSLVFSDCQEDFQEFSMSPDGDSLDRGCHEIEELGSGSEEDQTQQEISVYDSRTQVVTSHEPESSAMVEESDHSEPGMLMQERPHAKSLKKGLCHHCLKGNRFTVKVFCIVCDARYCRKCVLRVMGSMPEGRKCVTCIGFPIDESKRRNLGKCSKALKQVLTDCQVEQVMKAEKSCQVNQLSHSLVIVNGKPLTLEEAVELQTCAYPPERLRPGNYWYDNCSGFWGKEGHKPCQIISPGLSVGGHLMENASNGTTNVKINDRVITKTELLMLQFAGINCKGCPHFWVSHNGSYQEEGQKHMLGNIWEKPGIRMICALLSLPVPSKSFLSEEEIVNNGSKFGKENHDTNSTRKILLIGQDQSGTSAIYKQAKILHNVPFTEDERQKVKSLIQCNLYLYISILLEGLKQFEEEYSIQLQKKQIDKPGTSGISAENNETNIYSLSMKMKLFSDWLLEIVKSGNLELVFPAATREYSPLVEELWKDNAFQATYSRRNELPALPIVADYFLSRAGEISSAVYEPSDMDILYADGITPSNGLSSMEFQVPGSLPDMSIKATEQENPTLQRLVILIHCQPFIDNDTVYACRYQLIRMNASNLGEKCKWLNMFEEVDLVLFCVDLTSYDKFHMDNNLTLKNKMIESKNLFENLVTHPSFKDKAFLLILNKFDLLEKKIKTTPLTQCDWFHDFKPFINTHTNSKVRSGTNSSASIGQYGFQYIAAKFKRLFNDLTGRKLYVSLVTGLERNSVDAALRYGMEVLRWVDEEKKPNPINNEWSSESIETTS